MMECVKETVILEGKEDGEEEGNKRGRQGGGVGLSAKIRCYKKMEGWRKGGIQ